MERSSDERLNDLEGRVKALEEVVKLQAIEMNLMLRFFAERMRLRIDGIIAPLPLSEKWSRYGQHLNAWAGHFEGLGSIDLPDDPERA